MAPLASFVFVAFAPPPLSARAGEGSKPDKGRLPLLFALFCLLCAGLSLAEALWPPVAAGIETINSLVVPQL